MPTRTSVFMCINTHIYVERIYEIYILMYVYKGVYICVHINETAANSFVKCVCIAWLLRIN